MGHSTGNAIEPHFAGSLVVPVFDASGVVAELYGRKIADKQREGVPLHLYLPGPHRGVFNLDGWRGAADVIVCEALLDAMTFWCAGYRNVTSAFGVGGFTDELLQALIDNGTRRVLIAYDRDEAGERAAQALVPALSAHGIDCYRVQFPKSLDANAYALKIGPAPKSLGVVLQQATPMGSAKALPVMVASLPAPLESALLAEDVPVASSLAADAVAAAVDRPAADPAPVRSVPAASVPVIEGDAQQAVIVFGDRRYRVRGLAKNLSAETLKVNLLVVCGECMHIDTLDLCGFHASRSLIPFQAGH